MGEVHEGFTISEKKKQDAIEACAELIAQSGHCVSDGLHLRGVIRLQVLIIPPVTGPTQ